MTGRLPPTARQTQCATMRNAGTTAADIADQLGIHITTVYQHCEEWAYRTTGSPHYGWPYHPKATR